MKKITHKEIANVLGVSAPAVTQRINSGRGFYIDEAFKLSAHFNIPLEAWRDIKSFISTIITESKDQVNNKGNQNVPR